MAVAGEVLVAVRVDLASLLSVFCLNLGVILPGVADVLEAGPATPVLGTVTVVDAGLEGGLLLLQLVQTLKLLGDIAANEAEGGEGEY